MKYLAKKLAGFVMTMLVVSFLVFAAFAVIPGDPATAMLGTQATPEKLAALREQMGLNEPLLVRFGSWAVNFIQGDFGTSYKYQMSVRSMIAEKIPVTLTLTAMSFLIMVAVSIPVGLFCAHHAGGKVDRIVLIVNQVIMAIPPFFSGILITLLFGLVLHLFTPGGYVSYTTSVTGFLGYLIFPSVAIALPKAAMAIKLLRTSVLSEMKLDYVRTAYSRGNNTKGVLYQHVLRNAIIPVITFLGMALADMVVSRAGSNSINEFLALNKPMLLIPLSRNASRGDQVDNAEDFRSHGYCRVLIQEDMTPQSLVQAVDDAFAHREEMRACMKNAGAAHGAENVMRVIREVAGENAEN